jgi:hypothetical protein
VFPRHGRLSLSNGDASINKTLKTGLTTPVLWSFNVSGRFIDLTFICFILSTLVSVSPSLGIKDA